MGDIMSRIFGRGCGDISATFVDGGAAGSANAFRGQGDEGHEYDTEGTVESGVEQTDPSRS